MSSRIKPYITNQTDFNSLFRRRLVIPMNQRSFSWTPENSLKYIDDILTIWKDKKYVLRIGSIISYKNNDIYEIYDGQQRIISTILLLKSIALVSKDSAINKNFESLLLKDSLDELTEKEKIINEKYDNIPIISCITPRDNDSLLKIMNNKFDFAIDYMKNVNEITSINEIKNRDNYICNICCKSRKKYRDFVKYLEEEYNKNIIKETDYSNNTNLEVCLNFYYNYLKINNFSLTELINLYKFIINDIDIQFYESSDYLYVSQIFEWENNRGNDVVKLDLMKNILLSRVPEDVREQVFDGWTKMRELKFKNDIYVRCGERLIDIAIQLMNNNIAVKFNYQEEFLKIIDNEPHRKFIEIKNKVYKLYDIFKEINEDRYGRLITTNKTNKPTWEGFMFCLLPIFYKINHVDKNLIKLVVKWYFRNSGFKQKTFNSLEYSNPMIAITNKVLSDESVDYIQELKHLFNKNSLQNSDYEKILKNHSFKNNVFASYLLFFIETCVSPDSHNIPLDLTLEHIIPKKKEKEFDLKNTNNIHLIGNLTLLEGKNSENKHKGNSSIKASEYDKKKESYKGSTSFITRDIVNKFNSFDENSIQERTNMIVERLIEYTTY